MPSPDHTFCFVVVFLFGWASADPPIPKIVQQFQANFTIDAQDAGTNVTTAINGFAAIDALNGGGYITFAGEAWVPFYIATTIILHPDKAVSETTGYSFYNGSCVAGATSRVDFGLRIPAGSVFLGNETIDDDVCMKWGHKKDDSAPGIFTFFVSYATHAVVRITGDNHFMDGNHMMLTFQNMQLGPFDPSIYDPPQLSCFPIPWDFMSAMDTLGVVPRSLPSVLWPITDAQRTAEPASLDTLLLQAIKQRLEDARRSGNQLPSKAPAIPRDPNLVAPPRPKLAHQFTADWVIDVNLLTFPLMLSGSVAFDYTLGGGLFTIATDIFPEDFSSNLVLHPTTANPDTANVTFYLYEGPLCFNCGNASVSGIQQQFGPPRVPQAFTYNGNATVGGRNCQVWSRADGFFGIFVTYNMLVTWDEFAYAGASVDVDGLPFATWYLQNLQVGPVNKHTFDPPNMPCFLPPDQTFDDDCNGPLLASLARLWEHVSR